MNNEQEVLYQKQYLDTLTLLCQQRKSKLESRVETQNCTGEGAVVANQVGEFPLEEKETRFADTKYEDISLKRRWITPVLKNGTVLLDTLDLLKSSADPTSAIVQAGYAAINRFKDEIILSGYYGANRTGKNGENSTSFAGGNVITHSTESGDLLKQINTVLQKMQDAEVDLDYEEITMVVNGLAVKKLRESGIYISNDFMNGKVLSEKVQMPDYCGVTFVRMGKVPSYTDSGTVYKLPIFAKSGVKFGNWGIQKIRVQEESTKQYCPSIFMEAVYGSCRTEECKCYSIEMK
jgi:hypothetical protein